MQPTVHITAEETRKTLCQQGEREEPALEKTTLTYGVACTSCLHTRTRPHLLTNKLKIKQPNLPSISCNTAVSRADQSLHHIKLFLLFLGDTVLRGLALNSGRDDSELAIFPPLPPMCRNYRHGFMLSWG